MSNTTEALAALHAAEAELEAALSAEKAAGADPVSVPPVAEASVVHALGPEQIAAMKDALSRDAPPCKPKWLNLPNHLGPIAINGS